MPKATIYLYPEELERIRQVNLILNQVSIHSVTPAKNDDGMDWHQVEIEYEEVNELVRWMLMVEQESRAIKLGTGEKADKKKFIREYLEGIEDLSFEIIDKEDPTSQKFESPMKLIEEAIKRAYKIRAQNHRMN